MNESYIILNWEQDWDEWYIFFNVTEDGKIVKYNILTDEIYEYEMERVVH